MGAYELIKHMDWLTEPSWYIDECKPHARNVKADERERLNLRYNKLRGNWFAGAIGDCWVALDYLPADVRKECENEVYALNNEVRTAIEHGGTNRQLVEKAELLMRKIKDYLGAIQA